MTVQTRGTTAVAVALAAAALLILNGCSPQDDDPVGTDAPPAVEGGGGDTSAQRDGQPVGAGENFPVALPGGWVVDALAESGLSSASGGVQLLYPGQDRDRLVAFYEDWTAEQAGEYQRTDAGNQTIYTSMVTSGPLTGSSIVVTGDEVWDGERYTLLQVTVPELRE